MSKKMFKPGGPLNIKPIGKDKYEMRIDIPTDADGMVGRECVDINCSPGYFKVKLGTGITEGHAIAYCPYCSTSAEPRAFFTQAQKDYALALAKNEAMDGMNRMVRDALGLGQTGKKKYGSGMISMEISYKPSKRRPVPRPIEEELRRDITCPHCGLEHAVFGLANWCADCGKDIFLIHVENEFQVVVKMLTAVSARRDELGARIAGRDVENALEDLVSIFEAVMKIITRRHLEEVGTPQDEVTQILENKVRNSYQNINSASQTYKKFVGKSLYEGIPEGDVEFIQVVFEKRHPITHNLGVVDRKYLDRVRSGELEGREVRVNEEELLSAIDITLRIITLAYQQITAPSNDSDMA